MKEQHIKINFTANGYVDQDILITDENYSPEQVITGLQNDSIVTTMQEGGDVVDVSNGDWYIIGTVVATESSLEHRHFDSDGDYELVVEPTKPFNMSRIALASAVGEVIGETGDHSCEDIIFLLGKAGNDIPPAGIDVIEKYELLTGIQLFNEIETIKRGFMSMMEVAYQAGKDGKDII